MTLEEAERHLVGADRILMQRLASKAYAAKWTAEQRRSAPLGRYIRLDQGDSA